jgi:hypothetical protein
VLVLSALTSPSFGSEAITCALNSGVMGGSAPSFSPSIIAAGAWELMHGRIRLANAARVRMVWLDSMRRCCRPGPKEVLCGSADVLRKL